MFVKRYYRHEARLLPSVRLELERWDSIAPLIVADLALPWATSAHVVDASPWGMGACRGEFSTDGVKSIGRISERWRFKMPAAAGAPSPTQPRRFAAFESGESVSLDAPPAIFLSGGPSSDGRTQNGAV